MVTDVFDAPPYGYGRTKKKGWLKPAKGPQYHEVRKLKVQLAMLVEQVAQLTVKPALTPQVPDPTPPPVVMGLEIPPPPVVGAKPKPKAKRKTK